MNKIKSVAPGSIAEELEIEPGDFLLSINGREVVDIIDLMYLTDDDFITVEVQKADGEVWELEIDKDYDETLGLEFENPIIDDATRCSNQCIFCFIDQLPKGMRSSLYFKDDDSRLSFLQGNFVTLTNLNEDKFNRIIEYRISPINVSVHTTDSELRKKMLGNRFAGNIMERLKKLTANGIVVNAQIVLCPGYNDGVALEKTLMDLLTLAPNLQSVAIVPIGLTRHREGLKEMQGFDKPLSEAVVRLVHGFQEVAIKRCGSRFAFLADEFYLLSEEALPPYEAYEEFIQHEDGVGMIRKLDYEVHQQIDQARPEPEAGQRILIVTGKAAEGHLRNLAELINQKYPSIDIAVKAIENRFFGERITVAGLITGQDIINQVGDAHEYSRVLLPIAMFRANEEVLLDDLTRSDLENELKTEVIIVDESAKAFIDSILYGGTNE